MKLPNFPITRMLLGISNIPFIIFNSFTMSEFLRVARSTLLLKDFLSIALNLLEQLIDQSSFKHMLLKHIKKVFNGHSEDFHQYHIIASDIVSKIATAYL